MKPVLFSVSYAGLWGQHFLSLEDFISHASKLGYSSVEIMAKRPHLSPLDWDDARINALAKHCRSHKIEVACLAAYTDFCAGAHNVEIPLNELQIGYIDWLGRVAEKLGCPAIRIFTSYETKALGFNQMWTRTVEAIRECCDRVIESGIQIGIQNHHDIGVHSKALAELLREIDKPNCKLMFDPWSPNLRGEELYETAKSMAPDVIYCTLADYVRLPRYRYQPAVVNYETDPIDVAKAVPMGEGDMDNLTFLNGLRDGGFDGHVAYEMCSPLRGGGSKKNLDSCARTFLKWFGKNFDA